MLDHSMMWVLQNFDMAMFILAVLFILLHAAIMRGKVSEAEIVYRWMALFAVGFTSIYTFITHVFFPEITAAIIGWPNSPFQYEVGIADLAFGVIAILSFKASYGFRLATVIGLTIWLWGDAIGHIYQMVMQGNFSIGNAGSWFWTDVFLPIILIICIVNLKPGKLVPHVRYE